MRWNNTPRILSLQFIFAAGISAFEVNMRTFVQAFRRFALHLVAFVASFFTKQETMDTKYQRTYGVLLDTMRRSNEWDGRRLRRQIMADLDALGIDANIETINPAATFLRVVKPYRPWRCLVLHYTIAEHEPPMYRRSYQWTALIDDFNGDAFSRAIQYGPENVADELAAFLVAA